MDTAKEIAESYATRMDAQRLKDGIISYAKQKIEDRDEQWCESLAEFRNFLQDDLIEIREFFLPEPKFE